MAQSSSLEFTGERFTPECVREMAYEHWHRYAWAAAVVAGKDVLDAACGEGYGSHLMAAHARSVAGLDIGEEAIAHAREHYQRDNLSFVRGSATELPWPDDQFDVVVSFETLEHLAEQEQLLAEFRRVLRPEGYLLISSPDKKTYSDETGYQNPFHVRELYRNELETLISGIFPAWRLYGQKLLFASTLWQLDAPGNDAQQHQFLTRQADAAVHSAAGPEYAPLYYLVAAAADASQLPALPSLSLYGDQEESIYTHYNEEVAKHIRAGMLLAEREEEIRQLRAQLELPWWRRLFKRS